MYANYDYNHKIEMVDAHKKPFKSFLWLKYHMKPKCVAFSRGIEFRCRGYSLDEKGKNKKTLSTAWIDFCMHEAINIVA